jgi:hypothetical protein
MVVLSSIVYGVTCLSIKFEHFFKSLRVFHIVPGVHLGSHDNVAVALLFNLCLVNGPSPNTGCICFIVVGRTRLYRLICSIKICIYSNQGNGAYFCDLDGETQPQTQSYCTPNPKLLQQVSLRFRVGFLHWNPPDVPDKQQNLYVYGVESLLYAERYIVPPTVDDLLDRRVHVV